MNDNLKLDIRKTEVDVNIDTMTAKIDANETGVYIVHEGNVVMYPLPRYGKIELSSRDFKIGHPRYQITAE